MNPADGLKGTSTAVVLMPRAAGQAQKPDTQFGEAGVCQKTIFRILCPRQNARNDEQLLGAAPRHYGAAQIKEMMKDTHYDF